MADDEAVREEKLNRWIQRARDLNLDPACELFATGDRFQTTYSPFRKISPVAGSILFCVSGSIAQRWFSRRPLHSAMPYHFLWAGIGAIFGYGLMRYRRYALAENDMYYFYYMTLHPEDFPPKEKVLFNDYLTSWIPVR